MYCNKCGKEVAEGSLFCTWCGAKLDTVVQPVTAAVEVSRPEVVSAGVITGEPVEEKSAQGIVPDTADTAAEHPASGNVSPSQNAAPDGGADSEHQGAAAGEASQEQSSTVGGIPPVNAHTSVGADMEVPLGLTDKQDKGRKYYTGAHLAICLAVTGVMAAVAGVFAGLYFSVIF